MDTPAWNTALRILAALAVLALCLLMFSNNKADVDLWGNVGFVTHPPWSPQYHLINTFSYTDADHAWINHEWLAEYILHHTWARLGNAGLLALKIVLGLGMTGLIALSLKRRGISGPVTFLYLLLTVSTMGYGFSTRPHHFTYLLLALLCFCLRHAPRKRSVWLMLFPLLGILWANLHGAFFIGVLALGLAALLALFRKTNATEPSPRRQAGLFALSAALCFLAALINPYGPRLWAFLLDSAARLRPHLSEWGPLHPVRHIESHADFMLLVLLSLIALARTRKPRDPLWTGFFVLACLGGLLMRRNIPLFAIVAAFVVPEHLDDVAGSRLEGLLAKMRPVYLAVFLATAAGGTFYNALTFDKENPLEIEIPQDQFPVAAMRFLEENQVKGNALVFWDWAEYAIWKLHPHCRVFIDGRFKSAYGDTVIADYHAFVYHDGPGWKNALDRYPTDILLLHPGNDVCPELLTLDDWCLVLEAPNTVLFLKRSVHGDTIERILSRQARLPQARPVEFFP